MSGQTDKQIRFTFAVDQRSLEQTRNAIRQLTSDIKKLVETMDRAGSALGGLGRGGGGGLFGGMSGKAGGINPSQQATVKGGSLLTQGITADAKALSTSARLGVDAVRNLTTGLRDGVMGQVREIERLKGALKDLNGEFQKMGSQSAGSQDVGYMRVMQQTRQKLQNAIAGHEVANANQNRLIGEAGGLVGPGQRVVTRGGVDYVEDVNKARGPGLVQRAAEGYQSGGIMGGIGGVMGLSKMALGTIAASVAGGLALANAGLNAGQASAMTNAQYRLQEPLREGRMGARIGGSIGALGMGIRGGDLASSMAYANLLSTGKLGVTAGSGMDRDRIDVAMANAGMAPTLSDASGRVMDVAGRGVNRLFGRGGAGSDAAATSLRMKNEMAAMSAQKAEEMAEQVRNMVASSPKVASMLNETVSNAFGDIGMARTGAIGLGLNKTGTNTRLAEFKSRTLGAGYDPGAVASAMAQLGGQAGRGLMGAGQQMLSLGLGGFGNAGQIYGTGAQFGGGGRAGAAGLLGAAQHGLGRGGMDVTAGSTVAGMVSGLMTGGNFMGASGQGLMEAMLGAGQTGSTGGDMRMARVLQSGMGEYGRNLSGQTDNLQQGINMLAANASGAGGWYAKKALMGMDPAQMIEMQRTGKMPQHLADQGLTMENVQGYNKFRNQYAFSRYMDEEGAGTAVGASVAGVKAAGGVGEYMKAHGITANSKEGRRLLEQLGTARQATEGGSLEGNIGALYAEIAGDKSLVGGGKGHGAGAVGIKGTIVGQEAERQAKLATEMGEFQAKNYETIKGGISMMVDNEHQLAGLTSNLVKGATDFDAALKVMTTALMDSLSIINPAKAAELRKQAREIADKAKFHGEAPTVSRTGMGTVTIPSVGGGSRSSTTRTR